ncbi:FAS1 domain containing protein [Naviculisporaceae sp. PSN 640]
MELSKHFLGLIRILVLFLSTLPTVSAKLPGLFEALNTNGATEFAALLQANPDLLDAAIYGDVGTVFAPIDSSYSSNHAARAALNTTEQQALAYQISSRALGWKNFTRPTLETLIATRLNEGNLDGMPQSVVLRIAKNNTTTSTSSGRSQRDYGNPQSKWPSYGKISTGLGDIINIIKPEIGFSKCQNSSEPNGFIHIVDKYFTLPQRLSTTLPKIPELSTFASLLDKSCPCLKHKLDTQASLTIFIPTNEAFAAAGITPDTATKNKNKNLNIEEIIKGMVIPNFVGYSPRIALPFGGIGFQTSMNGTWLFISATNIADGPYKGREQKLYVNDALVVRRNIMLENGVAHVIDKVLL